MGSENSLPESGKKKRHAGMFKPGQSGNPGGKPKGLVEVTELARTHTQAAITRLAQIMLSENERAAVAACDSILDRGWGRPAQSVEHKGELALSLVDAIRQAAQARGMSS